MWHIREKGGVYTGLWWGNLMERDHLENVGVDGNGSRRHRMGLWTGLIWLTITTNGKLL
jgi:hypothetical protein